MDIFVASTSIHKIAATEQAATKAYPGVSIAVHGLKASSGINEQPVGNEETLQGACNRLACIRGALQGQTRYDILVAMENGIFPVVLDGKQTWWDAGWVVVEDVGGNRGIASTTAVRLPDEDVRIAKERGFATTTVGSVIAERSGADGTDPHAHLTGGLMKRVSSLEQALLAALGQIRGK
jgi:non-canonical (house-cleaning) NTP pyrophosphatase